MRKRLSLAHRGAGADRKLIWDVSTLSVLGHQRPRPQGHWLFSEPDLPQPTVVLRPPVSWRFTPMEPGLLPLDVRGAAADSPAEGKRNPHREVLVNACEFPFQRETLATLGIDEASLIEVGPDRPFCIRARELVVPSDVPLVSPAWVCAFLRSEFLKSATRRGEATLRQPTYGRRPACRERGRGQGSVGRVQVRRDHRRAAVGAGTGGGIRVREFRRRSARRGPYEPRLL